MQYMKGDQIQTGIYYTRQEYLFLVCEVKSKYNNVYVNKYFE